MTRNSLDLLLCCVLAARLKGTPDAVRATAYRVGKKMHKRERHLATMFINSKDPLTMVEKVLTLWEEEANVQA